MTELTVRVSGVGETAARLTQIETGLGDPRMLPVLSAAAGMMHRYLMGISRERPPVGEQGVLPVISGRLKNSFFFGSGRIGGETVGFVRSNLGYGPPVEARRGFLRRTARDMAQPVNDFMSRYVAGVVR